MNRIAATLPLLVFAVAAPGAIDGVVQNRTSGQPQANAAVTLFDLSQGMTPAGSTKTDAAGKFSFAQDLKGPALVQAQHQGVTYNQMLQPGSPTTGVRLEVFDAARTAAAAKLAQHLLLLEPAEGRLAISESFFFENKGNVTLSDPANGALRLYLPAGMTGEARIMFQAPGAMPLQKPAVKTGQPFIYKLDVPIKPGETRIDVTYEVPYQGEGKFDSRFQQKSAVVRLAVPAGVTVKGAGIELLGEEPGSKAAIYNVTGDRLSLELSGTGALRAQGAAASGEEEGPGMQQILPRLYDRLYWVLGLSLAILALGFVTLYRRGAKAGGK